jgi:hypothetical protein
VQIKEVKERKRDKTKRRKGADGKISAKGLG